MAGPGLLKLSSSTEAAELAGRLRDAVLLARKYSAGAGPTCDATVRFLRGHATVTAALATVPERLDVVEIAGYDPVRRELAYAGPGEPPPWAPLHWLVLRVRPLDGFVLHVYPNTAAAARLVVDAEGIERLAPLLDGLRQNGFIQTPHAGLLAAGRDEREAASRLKEATQ